MAPTIQGTPELASTTPHPSSADLLPTETPAFSMTPGRTGVPARVSGLVGAQIGEYRVTGLIGEGGMGTVYSGEHPLIGKQVAIKVLKPALSEDPDAMSRFLAEAKAVNTIRHPNIVDIFAFGSLAEGEQYFVMELLVGRSFAAFLKERTTVTYADALPILDAILDALHAAHARGIVHRDLKPDNIFLADKPSGGFLVKLLDFGIAKFTEDAGSVGRTRTGVPIGTPLYMSPEQCHGRDVGVQSDLYSLGVIMYEMFTGRPPFNGKSIIELVNAHVMEEVPRPSEFVTFPEELERLILWCLEKDRTARPASAARLRELLLPVLRALAGPDAAAAPTPMPTLPENEVPSRSDSHVRSTGTRSPRRRDGSSRGLIIGLVLGALALAGIIVALVLSRPREPAPTRPAAPAPVARDAAAPAPPMTENVLIQFSIVPDGVRYTLSVDGRPLDKPEVWVPPSQKQRMEVRVEAPGYETYVARFYPLTHLTHTVQLVRKAATVEPPPPMSGGGRTPPRREPARMEPERPPERTMTGPATFDML
jgi:serine/threonine-protein kinase